MPSQPITLVVGAGDGLSAAVARRFAREGHALHLAARNLDKLAALAGEIGATLHACDVTDEGQVAALFKAIDKAGTPGVVVYNPSYRARGPLAELVPAEVQKALQVTAFGGFLVAQQAVRRMLARPDGAGGTLLFTGASASVKGYAQSAPFAMGKFALRGLAQSLARELSPKNIHVAHFVIDGGIAKAGRAGYEPDADGPDSRLKPEAIAETYWQIHAQHRSAWTWEVELRPWVERF